MRIGGGSSTTASRRVDPEHRDVGLVFQEHALFPHLTVADNVTFGLRNVGRAERAAPRATTGSSVVGLAATATATRTSCRAASASGSRWPGRWRRTRG